VFWRRFSSIRVVELYPKCARRERSENVRAACCSVACGHVRTLQPAVRAADVVRHCKSRRWGHDGAIDSRRSGWRRPSCRRRRAIRSTPGSVSCCVTPVSMTSLRRGARRSTPPRWVDRVWRRIYFRLLLVGYFEGLDSERAIAWRAADSLTLRDFLGLAFPEAPPDHSTISRTRRLIDLETHRDIFTSPRATEPHTRTFRAPWRAAMRRISSRFRSMVMGATPSMTWRNRLRSAFGNAPAARHLERRRRAGPSC
jgi:hypothetical protein